MSELKERKDLDPKYQWDISSVLADDAAFEDALSSCDEKIDGLSAYQGQLHTPEAVAEFLQKKGEVSLLMENVFCYASLRKSEDTRDAKAQSMYSRAYGKMVQMESVLAYAEPEILSLDDAALQILLNAEILKPYHFYLEDLLRFKAHTLTASEEQLLARFGEVLANPEQTADALLDADMVFDAVQDENGETHELSSSNFILLETSPDRTLRKNAFDSYYKTFQQHINTLASTYSGAVKGAVTEANIRHYDSSRQMSMAANNIPESVYDNLIETVHNRMDVMYRYVRLRKRLLKVDELHYYDLYTPLVSDITKKYTYEQAQRMVLEAVAPLGEDYVNRVKQAYEDRWIDVYPNKGKSGGAYSSGTYTSNPVILTNFTGTLDSVSTIAHEMGHSQHTWLTNHTQPYQYSNYSLFVAEVASTVNENLLIEHLLQNETDPKTRLSLLNQYMEGFKGTVYRQTMFAEFEKTAHALVEEGQAINSEVLCNLYLKLIQRYFGEDLVIDEAVKYEWSRIPHFYALFYVYVYATGYSSASAISQKILHEGQDAVNHYLEFLSMGSSRYPLDELKHGGVDLNTPEPIDLALDKFDQVLEEAEKIADELGL